MSERYDSDVEELIDIILDPDLTYDELVLFQEEYYQHGGFGERMSKKPLSEEIRLCALRLLVSYTENGFYADGPSIDHIIKRRIDG